MPIREALSATPQSLGEVLSNGKRYVVPMFQRDYAWGETEWSELWDDIVATEQAGEGAEHFLGALVLQPLTTTTLNIIDGQQRLVTLSLLALAVIGHIAQLGGTEDERTDNRERARLLRERFVSTKDSASLQHRSRLELNGSDNGFYQTYLVQGVRPPRPQTLKGSEKRLYDCSEFFSRRIAEHFQSRLSGPGLATFVEHVVASRLRFIEIRVENDQTAFSVFETLNARGMALGTADLLKNYLFALAAHGGASDLQQAQVTWDRVLRQVEQSDLASLLFYDLAAVVKSGLTERRVFVEVKRLVPQKINVFTFLRDLEAKAALYAALDDPSDEFWLAHAPELRRWVELLRVLGVEQYKSLALAAFDRLADRPEKLVRLFQNLAVISLRAMIAKVNTGDLQRAYQDAAYQVSQGALKSPAGIARALSAITPSDDQFEQAFAVAEIDPSGPRKRLVRFLLESLESRAAGVAVDLHSATIEHVLPENPATSWPAFRAEDHVRYHRRLANLTPLEARLNRELGAADFGRKRSVYQLSAYALTRAIDHAEWSPEAIRSRQAQWAKWAVELWRIPSDDGRA